MKLNDNIKDSILDSISKGVFAVDKDFRINFFNKVAEKISGKLKEEVIGKTCKQVFLSEYCINDCPLASLLGASGKSRGAESKIQTNYAAGLKPLPIKASVIYDENSEPAGSIISFVDTMPADQRKYETLNDSLFGSFIGRSRQMKEIFELIRDIADSDAPVFIRGESGTGKEMIADAIHSLSNRRLNPYVKINCSVFPVNLLASELFGHVRGSFTGAVKDRAGRFEIADKGTIFLDEIGEIPLQMQLQLLRILQEGTYERLGESITKKTDVRIIAATNIDPAEAIRSGKFREDLYYRLNVIPIEIPPLRDRKDDILPLIRYFLHKFSVYYNKEVRDVSSRVMDILINYNWPGNARELENVIEYAFVRTTGNGIIETEKLPAFLYNSHPVTAPDKTVLTEMPSEKERDILISALGNNRWNKTKAAEELGISRSTLWRKMKKFGL